MREPPVALLHTEIVAPKEVQWLGASLERPSTHSTCGIARVGYLRRGVGGRAEGALGSYLSSLR